MPISRPLLASLFGILALLAGRDAASAAANPQRTEIRVLIDASGSMRSNDPSNLRAPSLRLLARLLPDGVVAGAWQFGDDTTDLVPLGRVDERWRQAALERAARVGSRDMYTDVEAAILTATADWARPAKGVRREVIILTDGIIDVAEGKVESAASRQRLLAVHLAQLRRAGVTVNTIALSKKSDAALMQALASGTGGYHETVTRADGLERAFLRMFEASTTPDSLPLKDNAFVVDDSIREVTLVAFRAPDDPPIRLVQPDGETISAATAPANIRWEQDEGYDLITIEGPDAGKWQLEARADPDSRALILTDLQLRTTELAGTVTRPTDRELQVALLNRGERVEADAILDSTVFTVRVIGPDGSGRELPLNPGRRRGAFKAVLPALSVPGRHELIVSAESPTFMRERRQSLLVATPSTADVALPDEADIASLSESLTDEELVESPEPTVAGHGEVNHSGSPTTAEDHSEAAVEPPDASDTDAPDTASDDSETATSPVAADADAQGSEQGSVLADAASADESTQLKPALLTNIALVLAFNALLGGFGYAGYKRWKKQQSNADAAMEAI
jgi:hypothetical protein